MAKVTWVAVIVGCSLAAMATEAVPRTEPTTRTAASDSANRRIKNSPFEGALRRPLGLEEPQTPLRGWNQYFHEPVKSPDPLHPGTAEQRDRPDPGKLGRLPALRRCLWGRR